MRWRSGWSTMAIASTTTRRSTHERRPAPAAQPGRRAGRPAGARAADRRHRAVSTFDADGRVLAEDLVSALQVPPQDNSAMDGYAVRRAEIADEGVPLPVSQRIPAGSAGRSRCSPARRAHLHRRAGAGGRRRDRDAGGHRAAGRRPRAHPARAAPGSGFAAAARTSRAAARCWRAGERLPGGAGARRQHRPRPLQVARRPRVALFSTGDELVMPGRCRRRR